MVLEADMGLTEMALGGSNARYAADNTLLVKFFKHPRLNNEASAEAGRPVFKEEDYIQIMQPGNKDSIIIRPAMDMDKDRFAEHYAKYQARQTDDEMLEGTLLEEWPQVTRAQVEELRYLNVRTVEQLAAISDSNAQGLMGISMLREKAKKWLESAEEGKLQVELDKRDEEIATLKAQMAQLMAAQTPAESVEPALGETALDQDDDDEDDEDLDAAADQEPETGSAEEDPPAKKPAARNKRSRRKKAA